MLKAEIKHTTTNTLVHVVVVCLVVCSSATSSTVHVSSVDGSDKDGDGSILKPFANFLRAQTAVRELRNAGDVTVSIAAGEYFNTSLTLTERDSALQGRRVTWTGPVDGGRAAVYGGSRITGWTPYQGHIWKAPLPPGLTDAQGRALFHTLVQGERSAICARTPNFGSGFLPCSGGNTGFTCPPNVLPAHFDCVNSSCSAFTRAGYSSDIRAVLSVNLTAHSVTISSTNVDSSRGSFYLQGAVELLDQEGEWAVRHNTVYFWPYTKAGKPVSPESVVITAPKVQRILSFVGSDHKHSQVVSGVSVAWLHFIGASMPATYTYACRGTGPGASPFGANCAADGGPDTPDQTNTSPRESSQGMVYMENASSIEVANCSLRAGGIAGFWLQEANQNHRILNNWVEDFGGFGLYANGIEAGDQRYDSAVDADVNHGHLISGNIFHDGKGPSVLFALVIVSFKMVGR